ncbi:PPOX class F420-dependent oxidoreductase [Actinomadura sp. B10D3]|uniref:PPOX class F420-dependent oxidoreductase n=1 Tax=Actinomadura sp. B10D3 TaxID=3153557 RepID=UPI00325C47A6
MEAFTAEEIAYLKGQPVGRLATASQAGRPHVIPTTFHLNDGEGVLELGALALEEHGQKRLYVRDIEANERVAFAVDDMVSVDPWIPRGITIRGRAEIHHEGGERLGPQFGPRWIKIIPAFVASWGIETSPYDVRTRRLSA